MYIDTHAHLNDEQFDADREAVIGRAVAARVEAIVCVGTTLPSSRAAVRIAETYPQVYAAVGIHPNSCAEAAPGDWEQIAELIGCGAAVSAAPTAGETPAPQERHPRVVALGETGLDRYRDYSPFELQRENFQRHLRLGQEQNLPVIIHCRDAWADMLPLLREAAARGGGVGRPAPNKGLAPNNGGPLRGVLHAFSGDAVMAAECLELGLYISFAGNVTYTNKKFQTLRAAAATIPADRILIETDCPYLVPEPLRGRQRRNEPALVAHTAANLAALRGVPVEQLAAQTTANARRLFGLA